MTFRETHPNRISARYLQHFGATWWNLIPYHACRPEPGAGPAGPAGAERAAAGLVPAALALAPWRQLDALLLPRVALHGPARAGRDGARAGQPDGRRPLRHPRRHHRQLHEVGPQGRILRGKCDIFQRVITKLKLIYLPKIFPWDLWIYVPPNFKRFIKYGINIQWRAPCKASHNHKQNRFILYHRWRWFFLFKLFDNDISRATWNHKVGSSYQILSSSPRSWVLWSTNQLFVARLMRVMWAEVRLTRNISLFPSGVRISGLIRTYTFILKFPPIECAERTSSHLSL